MSKLKVGDITIENGSISFSQQQTTSIETPASHHTPHEESNLKETMASIPGSPILWIGASIVSPIIGVALWFYAASLLLILAPPLFFFGMFSAGVALVKRSHTRTTKQKTLMQKKHLLLENKKKVLSTLKNQNERWTFENISEKLDLQQEDLLIALKACVDEKQVEEELDTDTGDWYYVWQESEKKYVRPKSLDERLQEMKKDSSGIEE